LLAAVVKELFFAMKDVSGFRASEQASKQASMKFSLFTLHQLQGAPVLKPGVTSYASYCYNSAPIFNDAPKGSFAHSCCNGLSCI